MLLQLIKSRLLLMLFLYFSTNESSTGFHFFLSSPAHTTQDFNADLSYRLRECIMRSKKWLRLTRAAEKLLSQDKKFNNCNFQCRPASAQKSFNFEFKKAVKYS